MINLYDVINALKAIVIFKIIVKNADQVVKYATLTLFPDMVLLIGVLNV